MLSSANPAKDLGSLSMLPEGLPLPVASVVELVLEVVEGPRKRPLVMAVVPGNEAPRREAVEEDVGEEEE